jgi:hypothetical protein
MTQSDTYVRVEEIVTESVTYVSQWNELYIEELRAMAKVPLPLRKCSMSCFFSLIEIKMI